MRTMRWWSNGGVDAGEVEICRPWIWLGVSVPIVILRQASGSGGGAQDGNADGFAGCSAPERLLAEAVVNEPVKGVLLGWADKLDGAGRSVVLKCAGDLHFFGWY